MYLLSDIDRELSSLYAHEQRLRNAARALRQAAAAKIEQAERAERAAAEASARIAQLQARRGLDANTFANVSLRKS